MCSDQIEQGEGLTVERLSCASISLASYCPQCGIISRTTTTVLTLFAADLKKKKKRCRFIVWYLAWSTNHPTSLSYSLGHRTCLFISHLNFPGSILPGCHFRCTELFKHTNLHCPTRYPLTPGSTECTCKQSALPRSTTLEHVQCSQGLSPWALAFTLCTLPLSLDAL